VEVLPGQDDSGMYFYIDINGKLPEDLFDGSYISFIFREMLLPISELFAGAKSGINFPRINRQPVIRKNNF
jgi:hypothetical protein